jgi:hypothetical protein
MTLLKTARARCANYWIAKVADAPDLGLRNPRFQSRAFRFNSSHLFRGKIGLLARFRETQNGE